METVGLSPLLAGKEHVLSTTGVTEWLQKRNEARSSRFSYRCGDLVRARVSRLVTWEEISGRLAPSDAQRLHYREGALRFGDLRLPAGPGPFPVAVVIHGGCWRSENDLRHVSHLSTALARAGVATWTVEYRRIGDSGGGWPGTFEDVAAGTDYVRTLADVFPWTYVVSFSSGTRGWALALWLAARQNLPRSSPLSSAAPLAFTFVSLAGISDLRAFSEDPPLNASVAPLLGGTPEQVPERYSQANPIECSATSASATAARWVGFHRASRAGSDVCRA